MAGVKHIKVEATPEEIVKTAFDNNHRKENTLRQYVAQTLRLHAHFFQGSEELKDLRWVKTDCTELIEFLKSEYFHKLPAQHGYMFTLMIIAKDHLRDMALWKVYFDRHEEIKKAREALRPPLQQMTEHEGANWKTLEEITKKREELQRRVNRVILPKQPADIMIEDRIDLIRHLILCLYAYLPTLRNDYSDAPIIFMRDHRSSAIRKLMQGNHIMETAKGQFTFHLRYFKTDRTHAEKAYTFPTRMNNVVVESLTVFPRRYLLSCMRKPNTPMGRNYHSKFMAAIWPDANVGSSLMRKILISNEYKDAPSLKDRTEKASSCLHSVVIQQTHYEKKYKPDGTPIAW
jgi:hypothetical protein